MQQHLKLNHHRINIRMDNWLHTSRILLPGLLAILPAIVSGLQKGGEGTVALVAGKRALGTVLCLSKLQQKVFLLLSERYVKPHVLQPSSCILPVHASTAVRSLAGA
eukprot:752273-Hanusia_phi.AAC.3